MDNQSYNICLDLVEWFESVCQTIPHFDLSRCCFNIHGKIVRIPSPGILRVTLRDQASCLTLLADLRRWIQINIEVSLTTSNSKDLSCSLNYVSELLEREIEKEKYRPFFHGAINCSIKANWYFTNQSHTPISAPLIQKHSLKRKPSVRATTSATSEVTPPPSKKIVTTVSEPPPVRKVTYHRSIVTSDSDDERDADYKVSETTVSEPKKKLESKSSIRIKSPIVTTTAKEDSSSIPSQSPASSQPPSKPRPSVTVDPTLKQTIQSILKPLKENPSFDLFVDPVPQTVTDYYEFIETPLCLNDMIKKMNTGKYKRVSSILKDIQLIVVNCIYYNMLIDSQQTTNRKLAYQLYTTFLSLFYSHEPRLQEKGTLEEFNQLFTAYTQLIESIYAVQLNNYQIIRYFAVDPKKLYEYDRFVKKPITLRSILTKLVSMEYFSIDRISADFVLLFDNCITYWRGFNYTTGKAYIEGSEYLKEQFEIIFTTFSSSLSEPAKHLLATMNTLREKHKQELSERKKVDIRPSLISIQNLDDYSTSSPIHSVPIAQPSVITRTSNRIHNFEDPQFTPVWSEYAKKCLSLLQECTFPYWCWTLFLTPLDQLLKQPDYEKEILTPITWMMIEKKIGDIDKNTFAASFRLLFDNCLTYNQPSPPSSTSTPINWIRDPCKYLYNEFNLLWKSFAIEPTIQDYRNLLNELKKVRLDGYIPYYDFVENPKNYYNDYYTITEHPMGFTDSLHIHGTFDEWCETICKIFQDAMKYHSNNRGSPFIAAEAEFLLNEFQQISQVAKEIVAKGGTVDEIKHTPTKVSTESLHVYSVDPTRLTSEQVRKCKMILNEFRKHGEHFPLFRNYIRTPSRNTIEYLKHVDRLVYVNDISRLLDGNEYHNLNEFKNDCMNMISNLFYYYQGNEKKEVIELFTSFMKSVFGDIYLYSRVESPSGIDDYFNFNKSLLNKLYQDDKIDDFFKSFKQECRNSYHLLNSTTLRSIFPEISNDSEVVLNPEANAALLDRQLPTISELEENPIRNCGRNYIDFLNNVIHVLTVRLQAAEEIGSEILSSVTTKAIQKAKEIFASKIKNDVLNYKISTYQNKLTTTQLEKQRTIHRPAGNFVSYLNSNEMYIYDSPSLYMLKVAKKAVLREIKPEIVEKEKVKEKKDETPAPSVKLKLFGKDVEKENITPVATIMTNQEERKEEMEQVTNEEETYSIVESFEV